eukprot:366371-Chlamydomonas_euryale.AAC.11
MGRSLATPAPYVHRLTALGDAAFTTPNPAWSTSMTFCRCIMLHPGRLEHIHDMLYALLCTLQSAQKSTIEPMLSAVQNDYAASMTTLGLL